MENGALGKKFDAYPQRQSVTESINDLFKPPLCANVADKGAKNKKIMLNPIVSLFIHLGAPIGFFR